MSPLGGWLRRLLKLDRPPPPPPPAEPSDLTHILDLIRRAHGGVAAWAVGMRTGNLDAGGLEAPRALHERGTALAHLAAIDGRAHVQSEAEGTYVAVGDFPCGAGVLLLAADAAREAADAAVVDLRRLVAAMRLAEHTADESDRRSVARRFAALASGAVTLQGLAQGGAEFAQQITQRGAVIALDEPVGGAVRVVAASSGADQRLKDAVLAPGSPTARAVEQGIPVVSGGGEDVFGALSLGTERRERLRAGTAYALLDGHRSFGALVIVGPRINPETLTGESIAQLVTELGPRLAAARSVHAAEQQAKVDPLTGLANRRVFEAMLDRFRHEAATERRSVTLIYADLDHFKALNDTLGHGAGDHALRHVARVLERELRDGDVVARIGGEEFAVWLPDTALERGLEVAERIRAAIERSDWAGQREGAPHALTISCGVASYPDGVKDVHNLRAAADAALYRAKHSGRNRVESAGMSG